MKASLFLLLGLSLSFAAFVHCETDEFDEGVTVEDESVSCANNAARDNTRTDTCSAL